MCLNPGGVLQMANSNMEGDMAYSKQLIQQVWEKGRSGSRFDASMWREDECGAWISREDYSKPDSEFGWKIVKVSAEDAETLENLQPFHYRNGYDVANHKARRYVTADLTGLPTFEQISQPRNRKI